MDLRADSDGGGNPTTGSQVVRNLSSQRAVPRDLDQDCHLGGEDRAMRCVGSSTSGDNDPTAAVNEGLWAISPPECQGCRSRDDRRRGCPLARDVEPARPAWSPGAAGMPCSARTSRVPSKTDHVERLGGVGQTSTPSGGPWASSRTPGMLQPVPCGSRRPMPASGPSRRLRAPLSGRCSGRYLRGQAVLWARTGSSGLHIGSVDWTGDYEKFFATGVIQHDRRARTGEMSESATRRVV